MSAMPAPLHSDREYCLFHNDLGQSVGECALEVRGWLAAHPEYAGAVYGDWGTGGPRDHFDASEWFWPEADEDAEAVETIAEIQPQAKDANAVYQREVGRFLDTLLQRQMNHKRNGRAA